MAETPGFGLKRPSVRAAGSRWSSRTTDLGRSMVWKGMPGWNEPTTSVPTVRERRFFPLDRKLKLRHDHWSEGAARVATRHGLRAPSFKQAAEDYTDAVGGAISESSLRRVTLGMGEKMAAWKEVEAEWASAPAQRGEDHRSRRVAAKDPITGQANVSSDGVKIRIRDEGWKEVKISSISKVEVKAPDPKRKSSTRGEAAGSRPSRRGEDPLVRLS